MFWFTADEHFGHSKIIEYCERPFNSTKDMDNVIIENFNDRVAKDDVIIHAGDFCFSTKRTNALKYVYRLNGNHIFLKGCHDYWLPNGASYIWQRRFETIDNLIVVCHWCMRTWKASHYNSFHLFGHSHGKLEAVGKSYDVGVDNNSFYPVSLASIVAIMTTKPNNFNFVE
jgi:calcineurin-like phosphoesterase family protein